MSTPVQAAAPRIDPEMLLNKVQSQLHDGADLQQAVGFAYPDIMTLMDAERVTIYQKDKMSGDMVSRFKVADDLKEIRVSASTTSLSGYCALSRQIINVEDVYDAQALSKIHPALVFQDSFDRASGFRTRAMMVLPILFHDALFGVLQVINRRRGGPFNDLDVSVAKKLATILAQKLRYELQATSSPYAHLISNGRLKQSELDDIKLRAVKTKQTVSLLLMREMRLSASEIGASMERHYQIPYMPFDPAVVIPKELVQGIKESYLRACGWLPVAGDRKEVTILIDDPTDSAKLREIQTLVNAQKYVFKLGLPEDMLRFLGQEVSTTGDGDSATNASAPARTETNIGDASDENDAVVVQLVNRLLMQAYLDRASDIHIEPAGGNTPTGVRFRVDGSCLWKEDFPAEIHRSVISRIKILAKLDISEQRKPQDGKLMVRFKGNPLEFRIATIPTVHGESMVMRLLASGAKLMKIDEMNLAPHYHGMLHKVLAQPHGVFLVVGPTGSGKTTSLHALLNHLNTTDRKIWTAEDPVEITQKGLQQVQVHPKIGFTFAAAMRSFLRCDPDIIMVGEMRDQETATIGIEASLTGHLVFSTLHSNSAPETLTRLMDLGVDKSSFADALLGVMSQRLMRKLCSKCKQPVQLTPDIQTDLKALYGERFDEDCGAYLTTSTLFRHGKCDACQNTGFHGRVPIHEFLVASPDLKRLISQGARLENLIEAACQAGMRTLIQDQIIKAFQGLVDVDEVRGVI